MTDSSRYRAPRGGGVIGCGTMAAILFALDYAFIAGSIVIRDADASVGQVLLADSERTLPTHRLGPIHFSTIKLEGDAIVCCRNGKPLPFGYIIAATHIWRTVRTADCRRGARAVLN